MLHDLDGKTHAAELHRENMKVENGSGRRNGGVCNEPKMRISNIWKAMILLSSFIDGEKLAFSPLE